MGESLLSSLAGKLLFTCMQKDMKQIRVERFKLWFQTLIVVYFLTKQNVIKFCHVLQHLSVAFHHVSEYTVLAEGEIIFNEQLFETIWCGLVLNCSMDIRLFSIAERN